MKRRILEPVSCSDGAGNLCNTGRGGRAIPRKELGTNICESFIRDGEDGK
jgi:hypothetical protein